MPPTTSVINFQAKTSDQDDSLIDWASAFESAATWLRQNPEIIISAVVVDTNSILNEPLPGESASDHLSDILLGNRKIVPPQGCLSILYVEG